MPATKEQQKMTRALTCLCSHPTRIEIANLLHADPNGGTSAKMLHEAGVGPLQTIAYHMRELRNCKVISVKRRVRTRGAYETFCELTPEGRGAYHALTHARPLYLTARGRTPATGATE